MDAFEHESLEVYQVAIEFAVLADKLTKSLTPARAHLAERLSAESTGVVVNIARGAGEGHPKAMAGYLHRARRSVHACAALVDLARTLKTADEAQLTAGRGLLLKVSELLAKVCDQIAQAQKKRR